MTKAATTRSGKNGPALRSRLFLVMVVVLLLIGSVSGDETIGNSHDINNSNSNVNNNNNNNSNNHDIIGSSNNNNNNHHQLSRRARMVQGPEDEDDDEGPPPQRIVSLAAQGGGRQGRKRNKKNNQKMKRRRRRKSKKPKNNSNSNNPVEDENDETSISLVSGVDDKDVYCEDLAQYEDWHNVRVAKDDGIMYNVVKKLPHDAGSFTQGLAYANGKLYESAGLYGESSVRIMDRSDGDIERRIAMDDQYFAEGITFYNDTLVQITWQKQKGFVYNSSTLELLDEFDFSTTRNEGWGIAWDRCQDELIVTDGSQYLHFWDPTTKQELRRTKVRRLNGDDAKNMNEIEFWRGRVLANVWYEDTILVIDPETGVVEKEYDFSELWPDRQREGAGVLNGISISQVKNVLYITGKLWNRMYKVKLLPNLNDV